MPKREYVIQLYQLMDLLEECQHNVYEFHYLTCAWKSAQFGREAAAHSQA